jgi:hypothetical protein
MNVVIYTKDFEPINVIDLPLSLLDDMERKGGVKLAIPSLNNNGSMTTCTLLLKNLRWMDGTTKPILITLDEEVALVLKPNWLPGQRATVNSYEECIQTLIKRLRAAWRKNEED